MPIAVKSSLSPSGRVNVSPDLWRAWARRPRHPFRSGARPVTPPPPPEHREAAPEPRLVRPAALWATTGDSRTTLTNYGAGPVRRSAAAILTCQGFAMIYWLAGADIAFAIGAKLTPS